MHSRRQEKVTEAEILLPSEGWLVGQSMLLVIVSSWSCGSMTTRALDWTTTIVALGLPLLALRFQETRQWRWRPFVPALLWIAFCLIALGNPSHVSTPTGWIPRPAWIPWLPSTVDRAHTAGDLQLWGTALIEGGLVVALLRTRRAARLIWAVVSVNGFALAATGALFHFSGSQLMLGFIEPPEATYFFASFFYKNHWAAYGALAALASLLLALQFATAAFRGDGFARGRLLLFGALGTLTLVTLPLPGSRAGALFALAITGIFLVGMSVAWQRARRAGARRARLLVVLLVCTAGIIGYGLNAYWPRAAEDLTRTKREVDLASAGRENDLRVLVAHDTLQMARQRPLFGWGPGCFELVFPIYKGAYLRSADGRPTARFEFAHDDWLQTLAEDGAAGFILLLTPLAWLAYRAWRGTSVVGHLAILGCGLIALHAIIDFPLHNPAILLEWILMLGSVAALAPGARKSAGTAQDA